LETSISTRISSNFLKYFILSGVVVAITFFACIQHNANEPELTSPFKNVYGNANYVGSVVCANCHVEKHESFMHTGMGLSFDSATKTKSAGKFNTLPVYDSLNNLFYRAFFKDNKMFIKEWQLGVHGDTTHQREEQIAYIIGSGQHTNSHFWMNNGYVYQAPLTWYVQEQKWGLPPGYKENNIRFDRKIDVECMSCHNSLPIMDKRAANKYIEIPKGIGCERCHGPGSIHVDEKMKGIIVDTKKQTDYTIVNPKRLPYKLQMDVCQRCHLQGNAVLKEGKNFEDFRPGMPLSSVMKVYLPTYSNDNHDFVMASHAERFQQSACFIQTNKGSLETYNPVVNFTCINCHNPHISVTETKVSQFNNTCKGCHGGTKNQLECTENVIVRQKLENNCVSCHMPKTGASDIPHVTIHDHFIRKPGNVNDIASKGKLIGISSVNGGSTDIRTQLLAYLTYYEKFDPNPLYMQKADALAKQTDMDKLNYLSVHYWYNKANYSKVLELASSKDTNKVSNHFMVYQLAQSCFNEGNYSLAAIWYQKALSLQPLNLDYLLAQAINQIELTNLRTAELQLKNIILLQNKFDKPYFYLGLIYDLQQKRGMAKQMYQKAIALNPLYTEAKKRLEMRKGGLK